MPRARKAALGTGMVLLAGFVAYSALHEYVRAAVFVVLAANLGGLPAAAASLETDTVTERDLRVPWRGGGLPARWYSNGDDRHAPILLVPGVHASGIDEPRLVAVARHLASIGHPVLTTELADLKAYEITPRSTDMIEDAAAWLAGHSGLAPRGRVGLMGISFAGGLAIVASARPSVADRLEFVMSFGGHGDLPRTLRYLATGEMPGADVPPPHDYGVAIILLGAADQAVPEDQVEPLRTAILTFLEASRLDMVDKPRSRGEFARARKMAADLPEPARTLMGYVNDRDVARLGPILLPHIEAMDADPAHSPSMAPAPRAPVYLLHGADDNVIPAAESTQLAETLRSRGATVHLLTTPLVTHAEVDRPPSLGDLLDLVRFWGSLLDEG